MERTALCEAYNQALKAALQGLAAAGMPAIRLDAFAGDRAIIASPSQFGFTDVNNPYLSVGLQASADPSQFYYWDDAHPTTRVHRLMADAARNCLIDYYSPRHGRAVPPALANALNGLLRAGRGR